MRNFIFSIILLWSLTAFSQVAIAQEKVLTLSEAEALLEKAQQKYSKAKDAYRKSLKTGEETTTLKALRSASREVGRYRLEIFKVHKRDFLRERAELSDEEAAEFFPYYEELQNKLFRIHDDAQREIKRLLRSKEPVSDAEYQAAVAKKIEAVQEEAQVRLIRRKTCRTTINFCRKNNDVACRENRACTASTQAEPGVGIRGVVRSSRCRE